MGAGRSSTELETAAPDIFHEEAFFRRRTQLQGRANSGADDGTPTLATVPKGPWVDAAKMMAPPKLVPKVCPDIAMNTEYLMRCCDRLDNGV